MSEYCKFEMIDYLFFHRKLLLWILYGGVYGKQCIWMLSE